MRLTKGDKVFLIGLSVDIDFILGQWEDCLEALAGGSYDQIVFLKGHFACHESSIYCSGQEWMG